MKDRTKDFIELFRAVLGIFLITLWMCSSAYALDFDNRINLIDIKDLETLTLEKEKILTKYPPVEIKNSFGLGDTIIKAEIDKHDFDCGNTCESIIKGTNYEKRKILDDLKFYKDNKEVTIPYELYLVEYTTKSKDVIEEICYNDYNLVNGTEHYSCYNQIVSKEVTEEILTPYNNEEIIGDYYLKIVGHKNSEDTIDWIPTLAGQSINSWAIWNGLNIQTNLIRYYYLDEVSGNAIDDMGLGNGTAFTDGGSINYRQTGFLNYSYNFSSSGATSGAHLNLTGVTAISKSNFSINFFINPTFTRTADGTEQNIFCDMNGAGQGICLDIYKGNSSVYRLSFSVDHVTAPATYITRNISISNWDMVTLTYNNNTKENKIFIDGVSAEVMAKQNGTGNVRNGTLLMIGKKGSVAKSYYSGAIDEVGIWANRVLNSSDLTYLMGFYGASNELITYPSTGANLLNNIPITFTATNINNNPNSNLTIYYSNGTLLTTLNNNSCAGTSPNWTYTFNQAGQYIINGTGYGVTTNPINAITINISNYLINSASYNEVVTETSTQDYYLNISYDSSYYNSISATLIYNGTSYVSTKTVNGNEVIFSNELDVPTVSSSTNVTFYWTISFINSSGITYVNTSNYLQNISNINLDTCGSYTNLLLNISLYDEDTKILVNGTALNSSIEYYINIGEATSLIGNLSRSNNLRICTESLLDGINMDYTLEYSTNSHVNEFYNVDNYLIENSSYPIQVKLYDLLITSSQEFEIILKNANYNPEQGAIIEIQRLYTGSSDIPVVEAPRSDNEGKTVAHLVTSDVIYNFIIKKNGEVIGSFNNYQAICLDGINCIINLRLSQADVNPAYFNDFGGLRVINEYNVTTKTYYLYYTSINNNVVDTNLTIKIKNVTVCSQTQTANSGVLICVIPSGYDYQRAVINAYVNNNLFFTDYINVSGNIGAFIPSIKYVIAIFMILVLTLMGISGGPATTIIFFAIGVILSSSLYLIDLGNGNSISKVLAISYLIISLVFLLIKIVGRKR